MGCMGLTHASGDAMPTADAARVIREAFEMGYTFFDTAECYVGADAAGNELMNEDAVGLALEPVRDQVVIATKFGVRHNPDRSLALDSRPKTIRSSLEGSLRRLRTDHVDLCYQHRIDPNVEPEEVAGVMADLIAEGKVRARGISEATEDYLRRANAVCPVAAAQNRLRENLGAADVELSADEVARIDRALDGMDLAVFGGHTAQRGGASA